MRSMTGTKCIIGIDPGITGAVAYNYGETVEVYDMPRTLFGIDSLFRTFIPDPIAVIEVSQPVPMEGAASIATFFKHIGHLQGLLYSNGIKWMEVRPQDWKRAMGCKGKTRAEQKAWSIAEAKSLYPDK